MRENKPFGKRVAVHKDKQEVNLGEVFGITNNGFASRQVQKFIKQTTGIEHFKGEIMENDNA